MANSRVPAALDALLAALQAAPALQSPVIVLDGPEVVDDAITDVVWVGYDGDPGGDDPSVSFSQAWAGLGARAKDEEFTITCAAVSWTGASNPGAVKVQRDRVYQLFGAVEEVLRADPSLGLPSPACFTVAEGRFHQEPTTEGTQARLVFFVGSKTRI